MSLPYTEQNLLQAYAQLPLDITHGEGCMIYTSDGRAILDLYGGHAVAALGYNHKTWCATLAEQAKLLAFQSNAVHSKTRAIAAEKLVAWAQLPLDQVFFVNSGAEANENALKIACAATSRKKIVAVEGSFHGRSAAASAVTWGSDKWYGFPEKPFEVMFIPANDCAALSAALTHDVAAFIVEPIQGVAGAVDMSPQFLQAARAKTSEAGALLIFDEVQCGSGRCGYPFAANKYGIVPDILTTAKALGAGFPVSALMLGAELAKKIAKGFLGTTFGGAPMACAMVSAVIDIIRQENLLENVRAREAQIRAECCVGAVTAVQGAGLLLGLRCKIPANEMQNHLLEHNILVGTAADPHIIRILAPYILESQHVTAFRDALLKIG